MRSLHADAVQSRISRCIPYLDWEMISIDGLQLPGHFYGQLLRLGPQPRVRRVVGVSHVPVGVAVAHVVHARGRRGRARLRRRRRHRATRARNHGHRRARVRRV